MDMDRSQTADEAMEMQRFPPLTMDYDGAPPPQSAGGSLIGPPGGQHNSEEEEDDNEAAQFSDQASDYGQNDDSDDDDDDEDDDDDDDDDLEYGYNPTEETVRTRNNYYFNLMVFLHRLAHQRDEDFETSLRLRVFGGGGGGILGAFVVPASDAAVAGLEKRAFHATAAEGRGDSECGVVTAGCPICLENFEDGEEVAVMPCSGGHEFHTNCITKWLGKSNTCPVCRHALPVYTHRRG